MFVAMQAHGAVLAFVLLQGNLVHGLLPDDSSYSLRHPPTHDFRSPTGNHPASSQTRRAPGHLQPGPQNSISKPAIPQLRMHAMNPVSPYVIDDAVVHNQSALAPWGVEEQQAAGGVRALMHGRRRPARYAQCNRCTIVRCAGGSRCTGHCRRNRKVFHCSDKNAAAKSGVSSPRDSGTGIGQCEHDGVATVSPLRPPASIVVTATAPFIGCAHIADRSADAACPAAGVRGVMYPAGSPTAIEYAVEFSSCTRTEYTPECTNRPYYPLGVCLCSKVSLSGEDLGYDACDASELDLPLADSRSGPDEVRVVIEERGTTVHTGIFDYTEPEDEPESEVEVRIQGIATDPTADVTVSLRIFQGTVVSIRNAEVGEVDGVVSDDYYGTTEAGTA